MHDSQCFFMTKSACLICSACCELVSVFYFLKLVSSMSDAGLSRQRSFFEINLPTSVF